MGILAVWNEYYTAKNYIQDALKTADKETTNNLKEALKCLEMFEKYIPLRGAE